MFHVSSARAAKPSAAFRGLASRVTTIALAALLAVVAVTLAVAATPSDRTKYDSLIQLMDTSKASEVHVFAPKALSP